MKTTCLFVALWRRLMPALTLSLLAHSTFGQETESTAAYVKVLGIAQDAGYPQAGCRKACCQKAWQDPAARRFATSLAIVDPLSSQQWIIDCTPDFREQLAMIQPAAGSAAYSTNLLDGIFLTHAHIGHYAGLVHFGREVIGADAIPVYAMPRMTEFLKENGPWEQLVKLNNIQLKPLFKQTRVKLNDRIQLTPIVVPHRDEYSETVGFRIDGPNTSALFIPDIDKWEKWDQQIETIILTVDVAYLDGTFFGNGEIPGRDMSLIPHPSIEESLQRFSRMSRANRNRVRFVHLNHTNPALDPDSEARRLIESTGCKVATQGEHFEL